MPLVLALELRGRDVGEEALRYRIGEPVGLGEYLGGSGVPLTLAERSGECRHKVGNGRPLAGVLGQALADHVQAGRQPAEVRLLVHGTE
ncbi:hypothetical protein ACWDA7_48100, partial [Streptomyces sp. NPDC001156]